MLRFIALVAVLLAAAIWLEPTLVPEDRVLVVRLRAPEEILRSMRERSRALGARVVDSVDSSPTPAVGSGPSPSADRLTEAERERLDRLVEQVTREP